ncbi:hypothetical protein CR513_27165, partial [Mucuna pruriens]
MTSYSVMCNTASYKKAYHTSGTPLRVPIFTIVINLHKGSIMGNIQSSNNYSEQFPVDDSFVVALRKTKGRKGREVVDTWSANYYSFGRTSCELDLTRTNCNKHEEELTISICDHATGHANNIVDFQMNMRVQEGLLLANLTLNGPKCIQQLPEKKTPIPQGGVLKSSSFLYGRDTDRKGLIVILRAKTWDDDEVLPYMITVKHYFVAASCSHGVSVMAKIRSNSGDGGLSVQLEKPSTQSKRYMLSMFDDVKGTGWRPNPSIELSNQNNEVPVISVGGKNNPANGNPFSYSISGQQNISSLVSTSGSTNGDYNGSIMGNIHSNSSNYTERLPLDDSSVAVLRKTKTCKGRDVVNTWSVEYCSFGRTNCELGLMKINGNKHKEEISISMEDHSSDNPNDDVDFWMDVTLKDDLLLGKVTVNGPRSMLRLPQCKTCLAHGGVLKASSYLYGRDNDRRGLIVMLRARRSDNDEELPYMITVKHYFVAASCSRGVSVVAKIRSGSGDGGMSIEIEKPSPQPKRDMLSMFDAVKDKGWWPNSISSDCAIELPNQNNNNPFPSSTGHSSIIGNSGSVKGNGNDYV